MSALNLDEIQNNDITFNCNGEIMKLTPEGMFYKGEFIADAGEAHKAFIQFMSNANSMDTNNMNNLSSFIEFGGSIRLLDLD